MTSPGVPDIYQGCELWNESLVDPDNRRPVDWPRRVRALDDVMALEGDPEAILARMHEGLPKLHVLRAACALRARRPASFGPDPAGNYQPLSAHGDAADHVVAFTRGDRGGADGATVAVVVPRLVYGLASRGGWGETALALPRGRWRNVLSGEALLDGGTVKLAALLARFPVALLERSDVDDAAERPSAAGAR